MAQSAKFIISIEWEALIVVKSPPIDDHSEGARCDALTAWKTRSDKDIF
jgi:hypothetical protein